MIRFYRLITGSGFKSFLIIFSILCTTQILFFTNSAFAQCSGTIVDGCCDPGGLGCTIEGGNVTICHDGGTIAPNTNSLAGNTPGKHFTSCTWVDSGGEPTTMGGCNVTVGSPNGGGHAGDSLGACVPPPTPTPNPSASPTPTPTAECNVDSDCDDMNACTEDICDDGECTNDPYTDQRQCLDTTCTEGFCGTGGNLGLCLEQDKDPLPLECTIPIPDPNHLSSYNVPTLSEWGMIFLGAFLLLFGILRLRKYSKV